MSNLNLTIKAILVSIFSLLLFMSCALRDEMPMTCRIVNLDQDWKMQSGEKLMEVGGQAISQNKYNDASWLKAVVPGTVLGSLATTSVIEDPYFGINMLKVDPNQFKKSWWFRHTFLLELNDFGKKISLRFNGINYRANLWVNGKKVVGKDTFAGTYRMFTFDISSHVKAGENTVALEMWQHADGEYSIGFVDWNPLPRDRNLGIFREVFLEVNEGVKIRSPFVYSKVNKETCKDAELFIQAELTNSSDKEVEGIVRVNYELGEVEKKVTLEAGETVSCKFSPEEFGQLSVKDVKLWWPNGMGDPNLYQFTTQFISEDRILDKVEKKYGIREVNSYLNKDKNRVFEINGKFVLLKGGGWVDDVLLQDTKESVEAQMRYVKHMNLNSIRCEGFWGKDETLYNLCDEYGILVMIGWSCHWEWDEYLGKPVHPKYGGPTTKEDIELIANYWLDQMLWLRNHPSIYVWMLGSDMLPAPDLERKYWELFNQYDMSRPVVTSAGGVGSEEGVIASNVVSEISGPTGMKMLGPYAYTPPVYWFTDTIRGGGYGFNTETCPGPNITPLASLKKMFPTDKLWPIDKEYWEYHTGRNAFKTLDRYRKALDARYGESTGVEEFAFKSQVTNYELMRPMFEAFIAHKPKSTGLVQWMLNSAWPELYWQLYDTYLQPNGAFYAVKKACNPLHAIYRYGFNDIYIANEDLNDANNLTVKIRVFDIKSNEIFNAEWKGDIESNTSRFIYKLPEIEVLSAVWFLDLRVFDANNKEVDNSIYWLSLKEDVLDYEAANELEWPYYTPSKEYANFTALDQLPEVELEYDYTFGQDARFGIVNLKLKNPANSIAFFIYMDVIDPATQESILPVFWDDNYVTLLPGEEREYRVKYFLNDASEGKPQIRVKAWNVDQLTLN